MSAAFLRVAICTVLSAAGFYFSLGLGEQWWLAWLAPVPVLWLAFGDARSWTAFGASFVCYALGATSILRAYGDVMPVPIMLLALLAPAASFGAAVMGAQRVLRRFGTVPAMLVLASLWTAFDFLASFSRAGGAVATPAASQVAAPLLIQGAALGGFTVITFLLGFVAAGLALTLRTRKPAPVLLALALFAANAGYGAWRLATSPTGASLRVALIDSDDAIGKIRSDDKVATLKAVDAYAARIASMHGVKLVVLPENIARLMPAWRDEAYARLANASARSGATLVAGFNTEIGGGQHNVSLTFVPGATAPIVYSKRRLVLGLETPTYQPGTAPQVLSNGIGLEICKDMDFQSMIRGDAVVLRPLLLAVPAWDFDRDDWSHARVAILRSVENGVPMARSARNGLLTLNDRYGRVLARAKTTAGFTIVTGDLPLGGRGGNTLYDRIGDVFGWLCLLLGFAMAAATWMPQKVA